MALEGDPALQGIRFMLIGIIRFHCSNESERRSLLCAKPEEEASLQTKPYVRSPFSAGPEGPSPAQVRLEERSRLQAETRRTISLLDIPPEKTYTSLGKSVKSRK